MGPSEHFTGLIDRESELDQLKELLHAGQIVTMVGPPGVGKTYLARELSTRLGSTVLGFATLADAKNSIELSESIAHAMGIAAQAGGRGALKEHIGHCLNRMRDGVLILDNAEHLISDVSEHLRVWRSDAPNITWFITSQRPLGFSGEQVFELKTLSVTESSSISAIQSSKAVEFLVRRVRSLGALSEPTPPETWNYFAQIARQLDGLPLALELAAHRMRTLSAVETLKHLESRFELLSRRSNYETSNRHDALETALDWSWSQLPDWGRSALAQCSVFRGRFDFEAAKAVLELTEFEHAPNILDVLELLLDRSLVQRCENEQVSQFRVLHSISAFARKKIPVSPELLRRHALHFGAVGGQAAQTSWRRACTERHWLKRNRLNLEWVVDGVTEHRQYDQALACILALDEILYATPLDHHLSRMKSVLEQTAAASPNALWLEVSLLKGRAHRFLGQIQESVATLTDTVASAVKTGAQRVEIAARADLSRSMRVLGESDQATMQMSKAYEGAVKNQDDRLCASILCSMGLIAFGTGRLTEAVHKLRDARDRTMASGHDQTERVAQVNLGRCHFELAEFDAAQRCFQKSIDLGALIGHEWSMGYGHFKSAEINGLRGQMNLAEDSFRIALKMLRRAGDHPHEAEALVARANCFLIIGQVNSALEQYDRALVALKHSSAPRTHVMVALGRAWGHALEDADRSAMDILNASLEITHRIGDPTLIAIVTCHAAVFAAQCGAFDHAFTHLEDSKTYVENSMPRAAGVFTLAQTFIALRQGDESSAVKLLARVKRSDERDLGLNVWFETQVMIRLIEKNLSHEGQIDAFDPDADLKILGRQYSVSGNDWVDLSQKDLLFRFLELLVHAHQTSRGTPIQIETIVDNLWPDEKMAWDAATARVYTAVSTLRRQGLRGLLVRRQGGYLFDENMKIARLAQKTVD